MISQNSNTGELDADEISDPQTMVFSCPVDHAGTAVYVKGWLVPGSARPPMVIVHDLAENVGYYRRAAKRLNEEGYSVYGFDLRGHGRSGMILGHIPHFSELVKDLLQVVSWIRYQSQGQVPILMGQGIGALIAVYFQIKYPLLCRGAILAAPCLGVNSYLSRSKRFIIRLLADLAPTMKIPPGITPKFISEINQPRKRGKGTKSMTPYSGITANFANELLNAIAGASESFLQYNAKSLILCPTSDKICDYTKLFSLIGRHPHKNQFTVIEVENQGHYLLTKGEKSLGRALEHIIPWLKDNVE